MTGRLVDYIASGAASGLPSAATVDAALTTGAAGFYYAADTQTLYCLDRTGTPSWDSLLLSAVAWGSITGTLSDQTDLNSALSGKAAAVHSHATSDVTGLDAELAAKLASSAVSAFGLTLIDDADAATARTTLGLAIGSNVQAYDSDLAAIAALTTTSYGRGLLTAASGADIKPVESIIIACSDETTALTTGAAKVTFRMPYAFTLTAVRASVTTAPTDAALTVDINEGGVSILSTKITIDATEKTSTTAATPAVVSDAALADDAEITIDIDTVGSTVAGAGLKVTLIGTRT